jgi:hypothetical protein
MGNEIVYDKEIVLRTAVIAGVSAYFIGDRNALAGAAGVVAGVLLDTIIVGIKQWIASRKEQSK